MIISIIAAIDEKRGLGKNNKMVWKIPNELKRFREITTPHPIIMGRKTFESVGRVLPNRYNIVITRDPGFKIQDLRSSENFIILDSLEHAIEAAKEKDSKEIFIIGGGQVFKEALEKDLVDKLYLTIVEGDYNADTFFPDYSRFSKVISEKEEESNGYKYKFLQLEKSPQKII